MATYRVTRNEEWVRTGTVEADSPEEALALAEDASNRVCWDREADYDHIIEESSQVHMPDGGSYGF